MTLVKICGVRTIEHATVAAEAGADMLGLVFAPSKRRIEPELAAEIGASLRANMADCMPLLVGLFVNETPEKIAAIVEMCQLDAIQLSGDELAEVADMLPDRLLLKAVRLAGHAREQAWLDQVPERVTLLVDAHVPGHYGGTGALANWERARELAARRPVMLAGGLTPETVGEAIRQVQPWAVDVSSGVEREGQKDSAAIRRFLAMARAAGEPVTR